MRIEHKGERREEAGPALRRAARELRRTTGMVEDLEQAVGLAIALAGKAGADQMLELQKLDHIQQKILGVADFLDALSGLMSPHWTVDARGAARCVLLAELGAKLGDPDARDDAPGAVESCELF